MGDRAGHAARDAEQLVTRARGAPARDCRTPAMEPTGDRSSCQHEPQGASRRAPGHAGRGAAEEDVALQRVVRVQPRRMRLVQVFADHRRFEDRCALFRTARDEDRLKALAERLTTEHGIKAAIYRRDLSLTPDVESLGKALPL